MDVAQASGVGVSGDAQRGASGREASWRTAPERTFVGHPEAGEAVGLALARRGRPGGGRKASVGGGDPEARRGAGRGGAHHERGEAAVGPVAAGGRQVDGVGVGEVAPDGLGAGGGGDHHGAGADAPVRVGADRPERPGLYGPARAAVAAGVEVERAADGIRAVKGRAAAGDERGRAEEHGGEQAQVELPEHRVGQMQAVEEDGRLRRAGAAHTRRGQPGQAVGPHEDGRLPPERVRHRGGVVQRHRRHRRRGARGRVEAARGRHDEFARGDVSSESVSPGHL